MALRGKRRWAAVGVLLGGGLAAWLFAVQGLGAAATSALRGVGFDAATVSVTGIGLAPGWRGVRLDAGVDSGDLAGAGTALGVPLGGRVRLSGSVAVGLSGWAVTATPLGCLEAAGERLSVQGQALSLPEGALLCGVEEAPLLRWLPGYVMLAAELRAKRLDLPGYALRIDGLAATLRQRQQSQTVEARAATLRRTVTPADMAPLAVTVAGERAGDGPWNVTGNASGGNGLLSAALSGSHDSATGDGRAELRTKPLKLNGKGPGLAAVSPLLAGLVTDAAGTLTAKATVAWSAKGMTSGGQLRVQGGAGKLGPVTVGGVNGVVALSSLSPPVIPDGQTLAVALLDVGVPLTDGTIRFGYGRDRRLDVDAASWNWAGGTLRADPFELSPTAPKGTVTLHAERVDLGRILDLIDVDGIEATGTLSGTLPVRLDGGAVRLDGGALEATGPGRLRYDPANPPSALKGEEGSPGALLLGALTDFHYDTLRLTIHGEAGGELETGLSVRGANPSFYDGYPVSLNLKLSGALDRILRQSLDAARIPDAVRERMTGFDQ